MKPRIAKNKVKNFDKLCGIAEKLRKQGKRIAHSHGVFDLLHPGHIRHFEAAKRKGDILVVTVTKDEWVNKGPGRPVFNQMLRAESVASLECVDYVAINEWPTAVETILRLKPDYYVKGSDYKNREDDLTGKICDEENAVKSVGGSICFTDDITFSSTKIVNAHFNLFPEETSQFLQRFKRRHSSESVINMLKGLKGVRVLVIGDAIVDEYHYCAGMGKPPKDDVIAAKYLNEERFLGGAFAVARHAANFCGKVELVTVIGTRNDYGDYIMRNLNPAIKKGFFYRDDVPTVVKRRFLNPSFLNKIFELSFIDDKPLDEKLTGRICSYLKKSLKRYDVVIAADFGHGFLNGEIIDALAKKSNFLAVNAQTNSANLGFNPVTKYPCADYVCIDEPEIRLATYDKFRDPEELIRKLSKSIKCGKFAVTLGHRGALTYEKKGGFTRIPAFSKEIVDRIGAGDAFLSITAPLVYKGHSIEAVGFIGNAVGALAVLIVGNRSAIEPVSLYKFITTLLK